MMKKLVVLMLVVGMASLASAATSLSTNAITIGIGSGTGSFTIDDTATVGAENYTVYLGAVPGTVASLDGVSILAGAGPDSSVNPDPYGYAGYFQLNSQDFSSPMDHQPGPQFSASVSGLEEGTYDIGLWTSGWAGAADETITVTVVPEPMTMVLLGLGGLFLRRKK